MTSRLAQSARFGLLLLLILIAGVFAPMAGHAAPYADYVMDARTGEVIHATNADTRLHPASLTKMMTLYIAFQAIDRGEITLDTEIIVTAEAANMAPSKLGLRAGQTIRLRYLLRAAAVKSANDAATAVGIGLAGSSQAFAARMNATAAAMGMNNSHFLNMNGLTQQGHYSTAHDMSILGRHLIYDFPQYYNLFSRRTADAGIAEVANTNRRFLDSYEGADGIKTGFTNAAGYNLVASAQRGQVRIIATVFGGTSTANRNARVSELLDLGFAEATQIVAARALDVVPYVETASAAPSNDAPANGPETVEPGASGRTIRVSGQVQNSIRPQSRPALEGDALIAAVTADVIEDVLAEALQTSASTAAPAEPEVTFAASTDAQPETLAALADVAQVERAATGEMLVAADVAAAVDEVTVEPEARPAEIIMTAEAIAPAEDPAADEGTEVVTRVSTSGGHHWGINLGRFNSEMSAQRFLLQATLAESEALDGGLRRIIQLSGGFDANVMGLTRDQADLACRRFQARGTTCFMIGTEES
jgi:D-alanyl-D-alanine carboxypeptidase